MSMMNSAVLCFFIFMTFLRSGHACMAMIPTDPRITRPPLITTSTTISEPTTTTEATTTTTSSTTSSTTSTTSTATSSTTTPLSCKSCPAPKYMMIPEECEDPLVSCDESLLISVPGPCVAATCAGNSLMQATKGSVLIISNHGIRCMEDGVTFEDAIDPTTFFPAATGTVTCFKICMLPLLSAICDANGGKCSRPVGDVSKLECNSPEMLFINDVAMQGPITCAKGVWSGQDGQALPNGFTADCRGSSV